MAATKLSQYNAALRHLGEARLATLTDDVEARYALDEAWDTATAFVLRQAAWEFALVQGPLNAGGTLVSGYTATYLFPTTWLRTHAVFQYSATGNRECPLVLRERGTASLSVNASGNVYMRHVSSDFLDPALASNPWPEHFAQAHAAYLAFSVAERVTGERGAAARMSQLFSSLLPEAVAIDAIAEDPWLSHQRSGAFLRAARAMADEGFWRFAIPEPATMTTAAGGGGGFARTVVLPTDWLSTRALYKVSASGQRRPFDVRERNGQWLTNETSFYAEYVSTGALDARLWPDLYMRAVLAKIEFDAGEKTEQAALVWKDALQTALRAEAEPPDPWLRHQFSGDFNRCVPAVISKGDWRFALKSQLYSAEIDQDAVPTDGSYPYRFTPPSDWFKTRSIFIAWDGAEVPIDVRERDGHWFTATDSFTVHYVSTAALDAANWPDSLAKAVLAYLELEVAPEDAKKNAAALWTEAIGAAQAEWSLPPNRWLGFQLDGSFWEAVKFVLAAGRWRGAIKTVNLTANATMAADGTISGTLAPTGIGDGSISPSYSAVFTKPGDWYRTIWMYRIAVDPTVNVGTVVRQDIDYRDEGGSWHTNFDTIQVRYLSRDGLAGTRTTPSFRNAVIAWLEYQASGHDPKRLLAYKDLLSRAENEDDNRERSPVNNVGRFVRARYGRTSSGSSGGGSVTTTGTVLGDGTVVLTP